MAGIPWIPSAFDWSWVLFLFLKNQTASYDICSPWHGTRSNGTETEMQFSVIPYIILKLYKIGGMDQVISYSVKYHWSVTNNMQLFIMHRTKTLFKLNTQNKPAELHYMHNLTHVFSWFNVYALQYLHVYLCISKFTFFFLPKTALYTIYELIFILTRRYFWYMHE